MHGGGSALDVALCEALPVLAAHTRDPWWLIGSAALVLWGVPGVACHDLDLLVSTADAERLERVWRDRRRHEFAPANDHLFRSRFARYGDFALPVETMGGLELRDPAGGWRPLVPSDRRALEHDGGTLYLPSLPALIAILEAFGRDKDLDKAERARRHLAAGPDLPATVPA